MKAMSTKYNETPETASRPFEMGRDGFVMGEGAGVLILETLEHAQARGAKIYCEIGAYDASCDAFHITSPDPEGKALGKSLKAVVEKAVLLMNPLITLMLMEHRLHTMTNLRLRL